MGKTTTEKNGIKRPGDGTNTGKIWELADKLREKHGKELTRAHVVAEAEKKGYNAGTTTTQYQNWRVFHGLGKQTTRAPKAAKAPAKKAAAKKAAPKSPKVPKAPKAEAAVSASA